MRGATIARVFDRLERMGEPLDKYRALEFFARAGDWQTTAYAARVKHLTAWEIDPGFETDLRRNLPGAHVCIGDSYAMALEQPYRGAFELIVFDNPQGVLGDHCEHFDALPLVPGLLASTGVVIFNVNRRPFDYDRSPEWQHRRQDYYGRDASALDAVVLLEFYARTFAAMGFTVRFAFEEQRNAEYLSYLAFGLEGR